MPSVSSSSSPSRKTHHNRKRASMYMHTPVISSHKEDEDKECHITHGIHATIREVEEDETYQRKNNNNNNDTSIQEEDRIVSNDSHCYSSPTKSTAKSTYPINVTPDKSPTSPMSPISILKTPKDTTSHYSNFQCQYSKRKCSSSLRTLQTKALTSILDTHSTLIRSIHTSTTELPFSQRCSLRKHLLQTTQFITRSQLKSLPHELHLLRSNKKNKNKLNGGPDDNESVNDDIRCNGLYWTGISRFEAWRGEKGKLKALELLKEGREYILKHGEDVKDDLKVVEDYMVFHGFPLEKWKKEHEHLQLKEEEVLQKQKQKIQKSMVQEKQKQEKNEETGLLNEWMNDNGWSDDEEVDTKQDNEVTIQTKEEHSTTTHNTHPSQTIQSILYEKGEKRCIEGSFCALKTVMNDQKNENKTLEQMKRVTRNSNTIPVRRSSRVATRDFHREQKELEKNIQKDQHITLLKNKKNHKILFSKKIKMKPHKVNRMDMFGIWKQTLSGKVKEDAKLKPQQQQKQRAAMIGSCVSEVICVQNMVLMILKKGTIVTDLQCQFELGNT